MSFSVLLQQTALVFLMIAVGYYARRRSIVTHEGSQMFSDLLMKVTLPLSLIASGNAETGPGVLVRLAQCLLLLLAFYAVCIVVSGGIAKVFKMDAGKRAVFIATSCFPNSAFIGMPFCVALFGEVGNIYGSAAILAYNLLFFTYAVTLFRPGEKFHLKTLATPVNFASCIMLVLLCTGVRLPAVVQALCQTVGAVTTPLALVIVGAMVAESGLKEVFCRRFLYGVTLLRCLLYPLALLGVLALLPLDATMARCTLVLASTAAGSLAAVVARQTDLEPRLASQAVVQTTLFLAVTLPFLMLLAEWAL